jgi:acetyl-CoA acyltransferase
MSQTVYVVDAARTAVGRFGGGLATVRPDDLAGHVLRALVERNHVPPEAIDEVVLGCANQAGEDNRNVARMATLLAGLPFEVPAHTINRLCASGLDAVHAAGRMIALGEAEIVLAGGVESMSRAPWSVPKPFTEPPRGNNVMYDTALGWRYPNPRLEARFPLEPMGETAENVAEKFAIAREAQDRFAVLSHEKAVSARANGRFADELIAVQAPAGKTTATIDADEGPRPDASLAALAKLRPAFRSGGSVTAGNSSTLNDGAAGLLLCSEAALQRHGFKAIARWMGGAAAGVDPRYMGIGPVPAVAKLLQRLGWRWSDIGLVELNEAFAAQALAILSQWPIDAARVNVNGGAIAIGHPLGCSGARIAGTLIHEMRRSHTKRGIATLCVGVGQGVASAFELV